MIAPIMKTRLSIIAIFTLASCLAFPTRVLGQPATTPDPFKPEANGNPGQPAIDPTTGLPAGNRGQPAIDPATGLPVYKGPAQNNRPADDTGPGRPPQTATNFGYGGGGGGGGMSFGGGGVGGFGGVSSSALNLRTGPPQGGISLTFFEAPSPKTSDEIAEDMQTLSYLLTRNLERAFADDSTDYKLGIPMLLGGEGRSVEASYIEGFGEVFKMGVRFPLVQPAGEETSSPKPARSSEWEEAKRAVSGSQAPFGASTDNLDGNRLSAGDPYDAKLVTTLKQRILETLKNASNLSHLGPDDWIVVTVTGAPIPAPGGHKATQGGVSSEDRFAARYGVSRSGPGSGGIGQLDSVRPTMMTLRIRMSNAQGYTSQKFSDEQFARQAQVATYLGPVSSNNRLFGSYYPGAAQRK